MKRIYLLLVLIAAGTVAFSQKTESTALVLIDIQDFYFPGGKAELAEPEKAAEQARKVLNFFRENNGLVVHVRHDFEPGGSIHKLVEPAQNEKVITKKEVNAFLNTELDQYLKQNQINKIVLAGMQTHMCLEAGTRAAHDLGYQCTVIADACATRDLQFGETIIQAKSVHLSTLATLTAYAKILNASEFVK